MQSKSCHGRGLVIRRDVLARKWQLYQQQMQRAGWFEWRYCKLPAISAAPTAWQKGGPFQAA
jgi:hypothetical protein